MATALSQSPLLLSAPQARQPSCRPQTAHSGSCHLDTLLTPPPLPGLVSSTAPHIIWRHHLTQQTPAVTLLSRGRLWSLSGPLHFGLCTTDCIRWSYVRCLMHSCLQSPKKHEGRGPQLLHSPWCFLMSPEPTGAQ